MSLPGGGSASLADRFAESMGQLLGPDFPCEIGLAVSGGGDSMAMLALTHGWARVWGVTLRVATVDHGLRQGSADEAAMVARECATLGHSHDTLRWNWDGKGNLQDAARRARLELIGAWSGGARYVLFAHTQDDVAETFLMRLARGSGVEGLSAMARTRDVRPAAGSGSDEGFTIIRPLLDMSRAELRHHASTLKVPFVDDPSNADERFDRVKARNALGALGIDARILAQTATRLSRATEALRRRAAEAAREVATEERLSAPTGDLLMDRDGFAALDRDTQLRILAAGLCWVSSQDYRPRLAPLETLLDRALSGGGGTLHGARTLVSARKIRICREYEVVRELAVTFETPASATWDTRWFGGGADWAGLTLRALGPEGWQQIPEKPDDCPPHDAAISLPAIYDGHRLVSCPALGHGPDPVPDYRPYPASFTAALLSR